MPGFKNYRRVDIYINNSFYYALTRKKSKNKIIHLLMIKKIIKINGIIKYAYTFSQTCYFEGLYTGVLSCVLTCAGYVSYHVS